MVIAIYYLYQNINKQLLKKAWIFFKLYMEDAFVSLIFATQKNIKWQY